MLVVTQNIRALLQSILEDIKTAFPSDESIIGLREVPGGDEVCGRILSIQNTIVGKIQSLLESNEELTQACPLGNLLVEQTIERYIYTRGLYYNHIKSQIVESVKDEIDGRPLLSDVKPPTTSNPHYDDKVNNYIDKKMIQTLFDINAKIKFDDVGNLFSLTETVMDGLKTRQSDISLKLASNGGETLHEPCIFSRVQKLTKILSTACRCSKNWLDDYEYKLQSGGVADVDFQQEIQGKPGDEKEIGRLGDTSPDGNDIYKNMFARHHDQFKENSTRGIVIEDDSPFDSHPSLSSQSNAGSFGNTVPRRTMEDDNTQTQTQAQASISQNQNQRDHINRKMHGKLAIQTTRDAEETILFNLCLQNSLATGSSGRPNKLIDTEIDE